MIALRDVTKSFRVGQGRRYVLRDVSLEMPTGVSVGVLGRNGAGKSTLLGMIGGSTSPDSGVIERVGTVSWPLGFAGGLQPTLTGAQNVRFIARIYGLDTDELVDSVADFAELGPFMHMPVSTYSSGMRARLAFGVSMGVDFDIYLIDEITAVGDSAFRRKCAETFRERLARSSIVMVSHSVAALREYCAAGVVLENGMLSWHDDIEEAIAVHEANMRAPRPVAS